jgi:methylmalonyl-CoA/ethylmalonyl-CoA epimerase
MTKPPAIPANALDHVSIAVPDLAAAAEFYRDTFGCEVSDPIDLPDQGMRIAYVILANAKIELMEPTDPTSTIAKFIERNPAGGLHHFCLTTPDVDRAAEATEHRIVGEGVSHHGRKLFFLHPKDAHGTLIEIEEDET